MECVMYLNGTTAEKRTETVCIYFSNIILALLYTWLAFTLYHYTGHWNWR